MKSNLLCCVLLLATAGAAEAQLIGIELADAKIARRYAKWTVEKKGRLMICGEPLFEVVEVDLSSSPPRINKPPSAQEVGLLVPDPARPGIELVRIDRRGSKVIVAKKRKVVINARDIARNGIHLIYQYETCTGLREEYLRRFAKVQELERALKKLKSGSPEWFAAQRRLLPALDGLVGWLRATLFPVAAVKMEKKYRSWIKKAGEDASRSRLEDAKATLATFEPPAAIAAAAERFGRAGLGFHGAATRHLRAVAYADVPRGVLDAGLLLGERIIEGFRSELVDPYLKPQERDPIPEELFQYYFLCPDEEALAVSFLEKHFGMSLAGPHRERRVKMAGHARRGAAGADFFEFWRYGSQSDFEGIVAHRVGHALAELAFARGGRGGVPAWAGEGFAYWTSYEFIQRNSVTCVAFALPRYDQKTEKEGVKPVERGMRAAFNALALDQGPPLDRLMRMKLVEMEAAGLAKSWSVIDWLISEHPAQLRPLLSATCATMRDGRTDLERLRPTLHELFALPRTKDAYKALDEQWQEYAASGQLEERKRR